MVGRTPATTVSLINPTIILWSGLLKYTPLVISLSLIGRRGTSCHKKCMDLFPEKSPEIP